MAEVESEAQVSEQQQVEAEALQKYNDSQKNVEESVSGQSEEVPEGFNSDGTPVEPDAHIPEKFRGKSLEDVIASYQELEKKVGQQSEPEDDNKGKETSEETSEETSDTNEGGAFDKYISEFNESGTISEASYEELAKLGLKKSDVDAYIEGQKAIASTFVSKVHKLTGGEEGYNSLIQWATTGIDADTINDYNDALAKGDTTKVERLVEYMYLKKQQANPTDKHPNRIQGDAGSDNGGMKAFTDKGEWQRATANPLYGKDVKYTNMVDKRFLASKRQGKI